MTKAFGRHLVVRVLRDGFGVVESAGDRAEGFGPGDLVFFSQSCTLDSGLEGVCLDDVLAVEGSCPREKIFDEIDLERCYQDSLWGGRENDDSKSEHDWVKYVAEYSHGVGRGEKHDFRARMLKTATLAVAAIESCDRRGCCSK